MVSGETAIWLLSDVESARQPAVQALILARCTVAIYRQQLKIEPA